MKTVTIWKCDICGKEGEWTDQHGWFGSWKDFEDKGRSGITVVCSDDCRSRVEPTKFEGNRRESVKRGTGKGGK